MASKSSSLIFLVLIEMLVSLGLAQAQLIIPPIAPLPGFPGIPIPNIPIIPTPPLPEIPGLPIPKIPRTPEVQIPIIPGVQIPGFPDISGPPEIQKCWASIVNIEGCYAEIFRAFQSGQTSFTVGSTCCKAVKEISSTCWPRMFPFNPFFPPQLQNYCSRYINPLPAVPPTTDVAPAPEDDAVALETGFY